MIQEFSLLSKFEKFEIFKENHYSLCERNTLVKRSFGQM